MEHSQPALQVVSRENLLKEERNKDYQDEYGYFLEKHYAPLFPISPPMFSGWQPKMNPELMAKGVISSTKKTRMSTVRPLGLNREMKKPPASIPMAKRNMSVAQFEQLSKLYPLEQKL